MLHWGSHGSRLLLTSAPGTHNLKKSQYLARD
jgi:hypothetical protein